MPRAGSHYNLGTSRGPDKIGSRAGPGQRAVSCTWLHYMVIIIHCARVLCARVGMLIYYSTLIRQSRNKLFYFSDVNGLSVNTTMFKFTFSHLMVWTSG